MVYNSCAIFTKPEYPLFKTIEKEGFAEAIIALANIFTPNK